MATNLSISKYPDAEVERILLIISQMNQFLTLNLRQVIGIDLSLIQPKW